MPRAEPSIAVVIPVKNGAALLPECLEALAPQLKPGDSLTVVDDASQDATAEIARSYGADVLRLDRPGGPYVARNEGWRATTQPYVLFTDARCVARPGFLTAVRGYSAGGADLIFCDIEIRNGHSLAAKAAHAKQHLRTSFYASDVFLPFFPTAGLVVKRAALEKVGGFRPSASGGDADLCWRIQLWGHTQIATVEETLMEWRPRVSVSDYLSQWRKYGTSDAQLRFAYAAAGAPEPKTRPRGRMVRPYGSRLVKGLLNCRSADDMQVLILNWIGDLGYELANRREIISLRDGSTSSVFAHDESAEVVQRLRELSNKPAAFNLGADH